MKKKLLLIILVLASLSSCEEGILDTYNDGTVYRLRGRGPTGGWIFYINPDWERDGWRYLEAAPVDQGTGVAWSTVTGTAIGTTSSATGSGQENSDMIILQNSGAASAARLCDDYTVNGYSDWFLPSRDELNLMCWNLQGKSDFSTNPDVPSGGVGSFQTGQYWTSTEYSSTSAYFQLFSDGYRAGQDKGTGCIVRAARRF